MDEYSMTTAEQDTPEAALPDSASAAGAQPQTQGTTPAGGGRDVSRRETAGQPGTAGRKDAARRQNAAPQQDAAVRQRGQRGAQQTGQGARPEQQAQNGQAGTPRQAQQAQNGQAGTSQQAQQAGAADEQNGQGGEQAGTVQPPAGQDGAPVVPIQFNHQYRELSIAEAATWAQKGMQADSLLQDLQYLAAANGAGSIPALLKALRGAHESMLIDQYSKRTGGDEQLARQLVELEQHKYGAAAQQIGRQQQQAQRQAAGQINQRLADEFIALQREIPEIGRFDQLPQAVIERSVKTGIPLIDSYLRYQYAAQRAAGQARQQQQAADSASAGSMQSASGAQPGAAVSAMLRGLFD